MVLGLLLMEMGQVIMFLDEQPIFLNRSRDCKIFFMLNSAEHEIYPVHIMLKCQQLLAF